MTSPLLLFGSIWNTIITICLIGIFRKVYVYQFHFEEKDDIYCVIVSYIVLFLSICLFKYTHNYFITIAYCGFICILNSNVGLLYLKSNKLDEITPYYEKYKNLANLDVYNCTLKELKELCKIAKISQKQALKLKLKYIDKYTYEKIADELKISVDCVRTELYRARKKIEDTFN